MESFITGTPGVRAALKATPQIVFKQAWWDTLGGGKIIDGTKAGDPDNGVDTNVLRPGLLMGKITASGKYAPCVMGVTQGAYTSGGTSITVTAAQATEIVRRIGTSGNLTYIGPPSTAGTNAVISSIAFSAVNTSTGVITTSTLGANLVAGSFVCSTDGSATPVTIIPDGYGIMVTANDNITRQDTPFPRFAIAGVVLTKSIAYYSGADVSLQAYVKTSLKNVGVWIFDDAF